MNVFIVHAHPEPRSFSGALLQQALSALAQAGHDVKVSDLYAMAFDPVSDRRNFTTVHDPDHLKQQQEEIYAARHGGFAPEIQAEIEKLRWCDALVLQFPLWWFSMPAILKGWVDRVFAMGVMYGSGVWYDHGAMKGKRAMVTCTTGGPRTMYSPDGLNGDIHAILAPIHHGILRFVGFDVLTPFLVYGPARAGEDLRQHYLERYDQRLRGMFQEMPLTYPHVEDFEPGTWRRKPCTTV